MILTERKWKYGTVAIYSDIEAELLAFDKDIRVLPAPFFYDKNTNFHLIRRLEPGSIGFPNGGYEVRGPSGEIRSFDLDQIIVHPYVVKHIATINKMTQPGTDEGKSKRGRKRKLKELGIEEKSKGTGKRGRKPLSDELKKQRELEAIERKLKSKGVRGRPKLSDEERIKRDLNQLNKEKSSKGRGRPRLTNEELLKRNIIKAEIKKRSGGKKGRPPKK